MQETEPEADDLDWGVITDYQDASSTPAPVPGADAASLVIAWPDSDVSGVDAPGEILYLTPPAADAVSVYGWAKLDVAITAILDYPMVEQVTWVDPEIFDEDSIGITYAELVDDVLADLGIAVTVLTEASAPVVEQATAPVRLVPAPSVSFSPDSALPVSPEPASFSGSELPEFAVAEPLFEPVPVAVLEPRCASRADACHRLGRRQSAGCGPSRSLSCLRFSISMNRSPAGPLSLSRPMSPNRRTPSPFRMPLISMNRCRNVRRRPFSMTFSASDGFFEQCPHT